MSKILVVDESINEPNPINDLLVNFFPQHEIISASLNPNILNTTESLSPDVILFDINDSINDCFGIYERLKNSEKIWNIPIILLINEETGTKNMVKSFEIGADSFLVKPVSEFQLFSLISIMLRVKEAEEQLKREKDLIQELINDNRLGLSESQVRYKGIFENTTNSIAIYRVTDNGENFIIVEFNRAAEKTEKIKKEELIGKRVTDVFPGVVEFGLLDVLKRVWKTGKSEFFPVRMYKDNRIEGWRENTVHKLPSGEIVAVYSDETERMQAEEALRESEKRFRQLAENIQEVFWVVSPDWNQVHYISPTYEDLWGSSCDSLYKNPRSWIDAIIAKDRKLISEYIQEKASGDLKELNFPDYRIVRPDKTTRWIEAKGFPVYDENGEVSRIVGIAKDITTQKNADKAFHAILESTVGIIGQDFFDKIVKELCLWLDCEMALIGKVEGNNDFRSLSIMKDGKLIDNISFTLKGTPCQAIGRNGFSCYPESVTELFPNVEHINKMGASGYVGTPLIDGNGNTIGILSAISCGKLDLPERAEEVMTILAARASAELERLKIEEEKKLVEAQLQQAQKMEAIGTLAGGIAHDFNNILQSIMLNTELALYSKTSGDSSSYRLEEVLNSSKRATDLVKQILTFSRQSETEVKPLQVSLVLKEALKMLRSSLPTTIEINKKIDTKSDLVMADPTQIHQVIMNLCTNAAYAMGEDGGILSVHLHSWKMDEEMTSQYHDLQPGPYLRLDVSDTGHGMDKMTMERIFDPFFTTKDRGKGTGLGLAVVYGIVKQLGGVIDVESEKGKGTTFSIFLPRIDRKISSKAVEIKPLPRGTERILIVDDEPALLDSLRISLERLGYSVAARASSIDALDSFRSRPGDFDVVITDQTMPKMTGSKLAKEILKIRADIPIILCTGFSDVITEEDAKALGIQDFIMKPIIMREIAGRLRKVLN